MGLIRVTFHCILLTSLHNVAFLQPSFLFLFPPLLLPPSLSPLPVVGSVHLLSTGPNNSWQMFFGHRCQSLHFTLCPSKSTTMGMTRRAPLCLFGKPWHLRLDMHVNRSVPFHRYSAAFITTVFKIIPLFSGWRYLANPCYVCSFSFSRHLPQPGRDPEI